MARIGSAGGRSAAVYTAAMAPPPTPKSQLWRRHAPMALAIALTFLLAALAFLQQRWLAQVSEGERQRAHAHLENAAASFAARLQRAAQPVGLRFPAVRAAAPPGSSAARAARRPARALAGHRRRAGPPGRPLGDRPRPRRAAAAPLPPRRKRAGAARRDSGAAGLRPARRADRRAARRRLVERAAAGRLDRAPAPRRRPRDPRRKHSRPGPRPCPSGCRTCSRRRPAASGRACRCPTGCRPGGRRPPPATAGGWCSSSTGRCSPNACCHSSPRATSATRNSACGWSPRKIPAA